MGVISDNVFEFISDPAGINLSLQASPRIFERVTVQDSLLAFYPVGEVFLKDKQGVIVSEYTIIEGMKFSTKFGSPETEVTSADGTKTFTKGGYLTHDYAWQMSQVHGNLPDADYIAGTNQFTIISNYHFKDYRNPTAYKGQPSDAAKLIANNVFGITDPDKLHIDETANDPNNIWYQGNRNSRTFLEYTLVKNAYATKVQNFDKVPFVSFINCNGEFYFCSYATLYAQTEVATYDLYFGLGKVQDYFAIQGITVLFGGSFQNKKRYRQEAFHLHEDATIENNILLLSEKFLPLDTQSHFPVNNVASNVGNTQNIINYGIVETGEEGRKAAQETFTFQDSALCFRLEISIYFNPKVVTGKTIYITVKDFIKQDNYSVNLSGKWLVIQSEHHMDVDNAIFSKITLARPSMPYAQDWAYLGNIIA